MKKAFSWKNLKYPVVLCPPMDGITDMAYRELIAEMGGTSALYCEFVNVNGINYNSLKTLFELRFTEKQRPAIAQLFGSDPEAFYEASKTVVKLGFDAIDINMGCPAHKVASKGCGCALMGDTKRAQEIVKATIKGANETWKEIGGAGEYEVTAKMRLGLNEETKDLVYDHAFAMLEAGAVCVAIHGRTLKQMYTGEADWNPVGNFKGAVEGFIVSNGDVARVFGSGDVKSLYEAFIRIITTGADGVMIGRGSFGNPWVFKKERVKKLRDLLKEIDWDTNWPNPIPLEEIPKDLIQKAKYELDSYQPSFDEIKEMAIHHAELMEKDKGPKGIIQMRKHLAWYFGGFPGAKELRSKLVVVNSVDEIKTVLDGFVLTQEEIIRIN